jgi:hypothetical protein
VAAVIADLDLRFPASGIADLEARAEQLVLLGQDCAEVPADLLDRAAQRWARRKPFLPKASELIELAREIRGEDRAADDAGGETLQEHCDRLNQQAWCRGEWRVVETAGGGRSLERRARGATA